MASQGDIVPQAASLVSWRAGRQHRRWFWARACSPALHVAAGSIKGRLRVPHSGIDPPDRRRWGAAGTSSLPQQAQKKEAPLMMLFLKNTRNPLGRSCPHTWSMTSEGRSLHLARPDPTQLDQHAARRAPCCAAQGKDGKGTSGGGSKRAASGRRPFFDSMALHLGMHDAPEQSDAVMAAKPPRGALARLS